MGATYTRQSSYADGDVITAAHTNDEFNQLLAAFQASTGHTHDGTANEGGPITKLLGTSITIGDATSGTDITVTFDGESNDGVLKWMEDEDYFEFSDDILVASTEKILFRDTAIYINSSTDGQLDVVADTEIQIAATTVDINGAVDISGNLSVGGNLDVTGTFDLSDSNFTNAGNIQLDSISGDSDTNTSITFSGSDVITVATGGTTSFTVDASQNILMNAAQKVQFRDTALTINSSTDGQMDIDADTELEITAPTVDINASTAVLVSNDLKLDSDAAVLGFGADNDVTLTHVADTGLLLNGTMALQFNDASQSINAPSATVLDINATDEIELNATLVDANANLDVSGTYTGGGLMTTGGNIVIPDSGNIGSASDTDAIAIASNGQVTLTQTLIGTALDISGDIDVDGTTNLDAVDVDGAVNFASDVTFADGADIITASAGTSNFRAGVNAGNSIQSGGNYNVVVGDEAGTAITTGDANTAVGYGALSTEDTASRSTAVGYRALLTQNAGDVNAGNTAVGFDAGFSISTGVENTLMGFAAGDALTAADFNVAIGRWALTADTKGNKSVAVGYNSLGNQNFTSSTDTFNVAVGHNAGLNVTTGIQNTLIGGIAGDALTSGSNNTVVGRDALGADTLGSRAVAIGDAALQSQNFTTATENYNVAAGYAAGANVTTGIRNTLIGGRTGDALIDADYNVAMGTDALTADTYGSRSVAIGTDALANQNFTSATDTYNTAVGHAAGAAVTTGLSNTLIGGLAGDSLTDADYNVAL